MLGLAALLLASATADTPQMLASASPWWEKVTYTIGGDGSQQSCSYETSLESGARSCDDVGASDGLPAAAAPSTGSYAKITIERRFTPGSDPDFGLAAGDTLLGGQVLALAIHPSGEVRGCEVLVSTGQVRPTYGCEQVRAERFEASAGDKSRDVTPAVMSILVYGHEEHIA